MAKMVAMVRIRDSCWMRELVLDPMALLLVCFVRVPCLSAFFLTKIMLSSMNELPPCPTMVLLSQDVRLGWANDDSHG